MSKYRYMGRMTLRAPARCEVCHKPYYAGNQHPIPEIVKQIGADGGTGWKREGQRARILTFALEFL
jgi:hypothetical protein